MNSLNDNITDEEKSVYIKILLAVATSDGIDQRELDFISLQADVLNISPSDIPSDTVTMDDINFSVISDKVKRIIIRDCIALAYIDNKYTDEEREKIQIVSQRMGISHGLVNEIEIWLIDYWSILQKGAEIFNLESE